MSNPQLILTRCSSLLYSSTEYRVPTCVCMALKRQSFHVRSASCTNKIHKGTCIQISIPGSKIWSVFIILAMVIWDPTVKLISTGIMHTTKFNCQIKITKVSAIVSWDLTDSHQYFQLQYYDTASIWQENGCFWQTYRIAPNFL